MEALVLQEPTSNSVKNGEPASVWPPAERSIFRAEARQHYVQNQEQVVLPPLVSRRIFVFLWILGLLLMLAGSLIVFWPLIGSPG
jgi:hypothetical protein